MCKYSITSFIDDFNSMFVVNAENLQQVYLLEEEELYEDGVFGRPGSIKTRTSSSPFLYFAGPHECQRFDERAHARRWSSKLHTGCEGPTDLLFLKMNDSTLS